MCRREKQFSRNSIILSERRDSISRNENQIIEFHVYCRAWWKAFISRKIDSKSVIIKKKLSWIMWSRSKQRLRILNQKIRSFRNHELNWIKSENDQKLFLIIIKINEIIRSSFELNDNIKKEKSISLNKSKLSFALSKRTNTDNFTRDKTFPNTKKEKEKKDDCKKTWQKKKKSRLMKRNKKTFVSQFFDIIQYLLSYILYER